MRKIYFLNLEDVNIYRCICEVEWISIFDVVVIVVCFLVGIIDLI